MNSIKEWWRDLWHDEFILIVRVADEATIHPDGTRTEKWKEVRYNATKLEKTTPKHFIFIDKEGHRNEIKYINPVDFHIIKLW